MDLLEEEAKIIPITSAITPLTHSLTPRNRNSRGVQTRSSLRNKEPEKGEKRFPTRHPNTCYKHKDWDLSVTGTTVLLGDSNLSRIPAFFESHIQIDSYPGGKFCHVPAIIKDLETQPQVKEILLGFGTNSRNDHAPTTCEDIKRAVEKLENTFPKAEIWIPLINFSNNLTPVQKKTLTEINIFIRGHFKHIQTFNPLLFHTEADDVHWTEKTALLIYQHWVRGLNEMPF